MAQMCSRVWSKGSCFYQQKNLTFSYGQHVLSSFCSLRMIYTFFLARKWPSNIHDPSWKRSSQRSTNSPNQAQLFWGRNFPKRCLRCVCNTGLGLWNGRSCCKPKDIREMRCGDGRCTELWPQFSLFGIVRGVEILRKDMKHEISIDQNPCYI